MQMRVRISCGTKQGGQGFLWTVENIAPKHSFWVSFTLLTLWRGFFTTNTSQNLGSNIPLDATSKGIKESKFVILLDFHKWIQWSLLYFSCPGWHNSKLAPLIRSPVHSHAQIIWLERFGINGHICEERGRLSGKGTFTDNPACFFIKGKPLVKFDKHKRERRGNFFFPVLWKTCVCTLLCKCQWL